MAKERRAKTRTRRVKRSIKKVPAKAVAPELTLDTSSKQARGLAAVSHLMQVDPRLAKIIKQVGTEYAIKIQSDPFRSLVEAIIYQQLAGRAADAIAARFLEIYGKTDFPVPAQILETEEAILRQAGLSGRKIEYIRDLAGRVADGRLNLADISAIAEDEKIIEQLTQVKGIGRWTAEMFLIFCLGRMDVLPVGDLGFRRAIQLNYGLEDLPSPETMHKIAKPWKPYSTVATWYLWKSLEKFKGIG